ncbi:MAG: ATP-binding cassette domain-containing protein [Bacteroidia bacterium]|nr:ATP-binding cassette domain-containing protein [Bacteroidia bacterium]
MAEQENNSAKAVTSTEAVVEMTHVKKSFGTNDVLKDINLKLLKGENLVVLGKSGSGKSVLIKCLIGLLQPDEGTINVLGQIVEDLKNEELNALRKKVGFLFQSGALYDSMSVRENLEFPLRDSKDLSQEEKTGLVEEALANVGLSEAIDKTPAELSGGMRKRLGLARTLILKPEIMLYDEPTTGLDPVTSREISELILEVQKKYNTSSIIITHDMPCARITANRIIVFKEGVAFAEGTFEELSKSEDEFVSEFFEQ